MTNTLESRIIVAIQHIVDKIVFEPHYRHWQRKMPHRLVEETDSMQGRPQSGGRRSCRPRSLPWWEPRTPESCRFGILLACKKLSTQSYQAACTWVFCVTLFCSWKLLTFNSRIVSLDLFFHKLNKNSEWKPFLVTGVVIFWQISDISS